MLIFFPSVLTAWITPTVFTLLLLHFMMVQWISRLDYCFLFIGQHRKRFLAVNLHIYRIDSYKSTEQFEETLFFLFYEWFSLGGLTYQQYNLTAWQTSSASSRDEEQAAEVWWAHFSLTLHFFKFWSLLTSTEFIRPHAPLLKHLNICSSISQHLETDFVQNLSSFLGTLDGAYLVNHSFEWKLHNY